MFAAPGLTEFVVVAVTSLFAIGVPTFAFILLWKTSSRVNRIENELRQLIGKVEQLSQHSR